MGVVEVFTIAPLLSYTESKFDVAKHCFKIAAPHLQRIEDS